MTVCQHVDQVRPVVPASEGCAECLATGDEWVHLRVCLTCGHVGCCDDSKNQHARKHAQAPGHPIVQSFEPGESWNWCYADQTFVRLPPNLVRPRQPADDPPDPEQVIRSYLVIAGLYTLSASLIWGVNTLFLLGAGLDIFAVFLVNSIFTGSMALFEIPTGVLADTRGRRVSFLLSVAILFLGTLGYVAVDAAGGGLAWFGLMSVVLGLGFTFYSGAMEAWLVDALEATGYEGQLDGVFARSALVSGAAMLAGTTGGGLLGTVDLALPFLVRALLLAAVFVVAAFTMHEIGFQPRQLGQGQWWPEMKRVTRVSLRYGWQMPSVRLLMLSSFIFSSYMAWGFYAWQPYFLELLGRDAPWVAGVVAALVALAMMAGNRLVELFTRFCGRRTTLLLWAAGIHGLAAVAVGLAGTFWLAVGFYLLSMVALGVLTPVKQAYLHQIIPSSERATVVSFDSLVGSGGTTVGQSGLGYLSRAGSIASGYLVGGAVTLLLLPVLWLLRRRDDEADIIVGAAAEGSACAAQGLPNVATVESQPVAAG